MLHFALLLLSACSPDPKEPVYSNYEAAIKARAADERLCIDHSRHTLFGNYGDFSAEPFVELAAASWPAWDELVQAGMYQKQEVQEPYQYQPSYNRTLKIPVRGYRYTLSDNFKPFLVTSSSFFSGNERKLCFATYAFDKVVSAKGPHLGFGGMSVVQVTYSLEPEALPDEIADQRKILEKYFPDLFNQSKTKTGNIALFLTKEGWKAKDMIKSPEELILNVQSK